MAIVVIIAGSALLFFMLDQPPSDTAAATTAALARNTTLIDPRPLQNVDGINFEVSSTSAQQEQGLSYRTNVPDNYAMLFAFPQDGQYGFWMKDMDVPLDMVWVTSDGTIASITPDIPADTYPEVYYPPEPIRYVLETRAGFAAEKGWKAGTLIALPAPY